MLDISARISIRMNVSGRSGLLFRSGKEGGGEGTKILLFYSSHFIPGWDLQVVR